MDNDPGNHLEQVLIRDINGLLTYDGMLLGDREIVISPDDVTDLDVTDVVVGRNDEYGRTVCHIHRPPNEESYWRHDTFIVWDDGRTTRFNVDISLDESQQRTMQELQGAHQALVKEFELLISRRVINSSDAEEMYDSVLMSLERTTSEVNDALLKSDELLEGQSMQTLRSVIQRVERDAPPSDAPYLEFTQLYAAIHTLRHAHYDAMELRTLLVERYLELSNQHMEKAEANLLPAIQPAEAWGLLQLLDKIR
jgi:hypothetical protein